jgi:hypothetical protein
MCSLNFEDVEGIRHFTQQNERRELREMFRNDFFLCGQWRELSVLLKNLRESRRPCSKMQHENLIKARNNSDSINHDEVFELFKLGKFANSLFYLEW